MDHSSSSSSSSSSSLLLLTQKDVDSLYDALSVLCAALDALHCPFILIAGSLLGAVRSRSILFCDDDVDIAVFAEDYERIVSELPKILKKCCFVRRPWPGADRIRLNAHAHVWIDVFVLKRYDSLDAVRDVVCMKDNGKSQSEEYIEACLAPLRADDVQWPIWHYDVRKSIELWPREFMCARELWPLRRDLSFGPLSNLPGPARPATLLRRAYGNDVFNVFRVASSHLQWSKIIKERWDARKSDLVPGEAVPLSDEHFVPVAHSKRPNASCSSRDIFRAWLDEEDARVFVASAPRPTHFGACMNAATFSSPLAFDFAVLRHVMEPHVSKARVQRDKVLKALPPFPDGFASIACEAQFAYDTSAYPLRQRLEEALGCSDLVQFHHANVAPLSVLKKEALSGLLVRERRERFVDVFIRFVLEVVLPQLPDSISAVRFQWFPIIRILRPTEFSLGCHSDTLYGLSPYNVNFVVPLTDSTNCASSLHVESAPGKEDWHPVVAPYGVCQRFFGALCLHWTSENTTYFTRGSLDFRVIPEALWDENHDQFTRKPGYYVRATKKADGKWNLADDFQLGQEPDNRFGCPFV